MLPDHLPSSDHVEKLGEALGRASVALKNQNVWPAKQIELCREAGVFKWFIPEEFGGEGWTDDQLLTGYLTLSRNCLTTTFILTQWVAACKRILGSENTDLKKRLLPKLADGSVFATVGISHLTTSRQHVAPVLQAKPTEGGDYSLSGFSPWVTAAPTADIIVLGASLEDGRQIIAAVDTDDESVQPSPGESLVALSASCTGRVDLNNKQITASDILAGPVENVMSTNSGGGAGGLQTSTLAVGLSTAAAHFLAEQAEKRGDLVPVAAKITEDARQLENYLYQLTRREQCKADAPELRRLANSLVLRSTQAALSAAKGAGFLAEHPVGRWATEALFFLVWSCPQGVVSANLCELARIE